MKDLINDKLVEIRKEFNEDLMDKIGNFNVLGGHASTALFLFNFYNHSKNEDDLSLALDFLERSIYLISNNCSLFSISGLSGIAWLVDYAQKNGYVDSEESDMLNEVDKLIYTYNEEEYSKGNFDFLHGTCGTILYLLRRENNPESEAFISNFVDVLASAAKIDEENFLVKWSSEIERNEKKIKVFNLSLSHGISAIISILTKIYRRNINREKTEFLLKGAINFVLSCESKSKNPVSKFPNFINQNNDPQNSELRWCYGDVGISIALFNASLALKDGDLKQKSIDILLHTTSRRDLKENGIADACFCHGSSGLAYIYNRFYLNTGVSQFQDGANYWYKKTIEFSVYEDGLAGYKAMYINEYVPRHGLLLGIAGIGLSLLSYVNSGNSNWDELLLIS